MKDNKNKSINLPDSSASEKKQTRFLFTCVANILYVIPCLMSLGVTAMYDGGLRPITLFALITTVLAIPFALYVMHLFNKKTGRRKAVACALAMIALHIVCAVNFGAWYIVMAPAMILDILMIIWSDIITLHS